MWRSRIAGREGMFEGAGCPEIVKTGVVRKRKNIRSPKRGRVGPLAWPLALRDLCKVGRLNQLRVPKAVRSTRKERRSRYPTNFAYRLQVDSCLATRRVFHKRILMIQKASKSWRRKGRIWKENWCKVLRMLRRPIRAT